jgi:hypothetical protein
MIFITLFFKLVLNSYELRTFLFHQICSFCKDNPGDKTKLTKLETPDEHTFNVSSVFINLSIGGEQ